ncbi:MocR-like pyridoxine biosynthesis transcription factor PdxR [Dictyobacter vulcani]|uniref:MocR-like pyridoxine biosynthesis transcription factor PdxR n=1 Tax=Dictyobacter vulcani TaxID=2607529 RepID=UPI003FCDB7C5
MPHWQAWAGTYVSPDLVLPSQTTVSTSSSAPRWLRPMPVQLVDEGPVLARTITFRPGMTTIPQESRDWWQTVWRKTAQCPPPTDYSSSEGELALRAAIAAYLGRSRGIVCTPDEVLITTGSARTLDLLIRSCLVAGDRIAIEEPGYPQARWQLLAAGMQVLPIAVDEDGLQVDALPTGKDAPLAIYLTPSHQYPLGSRLSLQRRLALLDWAQANDVLLIEDDYDSEFRFNAPPLPALASLDQRASVAYLGTFSKVVTPALRCGYLVAPRRLLQRVKQYSMLTDYHVSWPVQQALTLFLTEGYLERHIRRMRQHYAQCRARLHETLAPVAHLAALKGLEAGLHTYLELNATLSVARIIREAQTHRVIVTNIEACYMHIPDRQGLLLGYGGLSLEEIEWGAQRLRAVIQQEAGLERGAPVVKPARLLFKER